MSFHLDAKKGEVADKVLLPGDPLRAKYIAETFLEDATCYNNVRNMLGYTGTYNGVKVSIQGTGMGIPSAILYIHELINDYGVKDLIRVGTCGALQKDVKIRDVIIAQATTTDSSLMFKEFNPVYFAPVGNFDLLFKAYNLGKASGLNLNVGNVYSSDSFYSDNQALTNKLSDYGVLGVEMETAGLYYLGSKFNVNTLSLLTVSDHLITGEQTTSEERQTTFNDMITVALDTLTKE
ncbi:purine nucleoside phosphorylase DeoD-type [Halolactibacillus alkaliphilus]|uniref:Purine nucleoside phosphorylase DeoD-type n=1 Tax=Halolactibacillus alkaliphilus TaxID=442899 RepID=A0A511X0J6_9BACI|nr:purine-nucleoside phosphorylase [Halolactibacillus alkaliphilus]GEN56472.1 purine nucleoside phosphorylase DeoD-type [Halolactibacillus alkaliphilus]GGN64278.1 purine nucleoside phosphorylase DeoD-type [Halolactibacillus alkaliphilus]SFO61466.1 purine-nucleoside phosphorylase [Halolactibacillus alkaliphilus]